MEVGGEGEGGYLSHRTGQKHGRTEINLVSIVYNTRTNGAAAFISTSGLLKRNQNSNNCN